MLAVLELVLRMGHGTGMYSDYGKSTGQVVTAYSFLAVNFLWSVFGTFIALRVITGRLKLSRSVLILVVTWLVVLPITIGYLLGVGHS